MNYRPFTEKEFAGYQEFVEDFFESADMITGPTYAKVLRLLAFHQLQLFWAQESMWDVVKISDEAARKEAYFDEIDSQKALEYARERFQEDLPYLEKDHDGDCTNMPYSCTRCRMEEHFETAGNLLYETLAGNLGYLVGQTQFEGPEGKTWTLAGRTQRAEYFLESGSESLTLSPDQLDEYGFIPKDDE